MLTSFIITLILVSIAAGIILLVMRMWLNKIEQNSKPNNELVAWLQELGSRVEKSTLTVDNKLSQNMQIFNERLDRASSVISQVQKSIGEVSEIGRSMQELQHFLSSPKLRGNIGEQILKEMLAQYFPQGSFMLQYPFRNGEKVDAIIKITNGLIPIDSKFPIDNFRKMATALQPEEKARFKKEFDRDVRKHIQDISRKYINVAEGTVDYAIMYVPSESVYYEIINDAEMYDFASNLRILLVSPMSFYAYMKAILMSYEGQKIESQAKEIINMLRAIRKDHEKADEALNVLTKHVTNAYNQTSQVSKYFNSMEQKLSSTNFLSVEKTETLQEKLIE